MHGEDTEMHIIRTQLESMKRTHTLSRHQLQKHSFFPFSIHMYICEA